LWGTFWTGIGGICAFFFARAMLHTFGHGFFMSGVEPTMSIAAATIAGAAAWVGLATRTNLPVSTTHAIVGSLAGVGAFAFGGASIQWAIFLGKIVLPLLLSPLIAALVTAAVARGVRWLFGPATEADCLCADVEAVPVVTLTPNRAAAALALLSELPVIRLFTGRAGDCARTAPAFGFCLDHLHWLTSGATSFARGMNDGPKMAALVLAASVLLPGLSGLEFPTFLFVTAGMVLGSYVAGRRITAVLAERVTRMDHRSGFLTNLVTSALVASGAVWGLPMSTTHVSCSAIVGNGVQEDINQVNWRVVRVMLLAWLVTLPAAALFGIILYIGITRIT
jgi:PiT family inorganic phosphate transporter